MLYPRITNPAALILLAWALILAPVPAMLVIAAVALARKSLCKQFCKKDDDDES